MIEEYYMHLHENEPPAFNPDYRPYARRVGFEVAAHMHKQGFYSRHSREECAKEYQRRYKLAMELLEIGWQKALRAVEEEK